MLEDDLFLSLHSCREPYNQLVTYCTCFPMRKQQETAPLHADFNCFREQPSPGLTHTECDMLWPSLICSQVVQMGDKGGPKAGSLFGGRRSYNTSRAWTWQALPEHRAAPDCPAREEASLLEKGRKLSTTLLQGRLCLYVHRGDAGRAVLQLPPVTHHTFRGGMECQGKDPGNHKPKLTN